MLPVRGASAAGATGAVTSPIVGTVRWTTVRVNVRGHPTTSSPPLFVLDAGTAVRVVRVATDSGHRTWYLARVHSRLGWLAAWLTRGRVIAQPRAPAPAWSAARVTSFGVGDGLLGAPMACGGHLTSTIMGVAHRTLACGTRLRLRLAGRVVEAQVVDRGPFTAGLTFDLAPAVCRALGACYGTTSLEWQLVK